MQKNVFHLKEFDVILKIVLGIIFVPILLLNILGPLLIKKAQKLPARVKFNEHDEQEFLSSREEDFNALDESIRCLGFEYIGSSFMEDSHTKTNFSLYSNEKELTCAMVVSMVSNVKSITYVEFSQTYSDGSMLDVSNADQVSPFPKTDFKVAVRYPKITEIEELYSIFRKLKNSLKNSSTPIAYDKATGFNMVEEYMAMESDDLVSKGYCKEEIDEEGKRLLTLKGAYLITWKSVFPGNKFMNWSNASQARKLLNNA